ncbi:uncharacterized protein RJT20DRAFT_129888 [Scheffersomyces xylosifermentans]|uniref:uncharacterized protein n=1 Tax=Scheffersomyces xylosifermentans TaxID=1304137 RepID=UPI00315D2612
MAKIKLQVLLVPAYFANVPSAAVDPHLTKRFLHLADPDIQLGHIDIDIANRYRKLYPEEDPLEIEKLQDNDNCDLDPAFLIRDIFNAGDVLRIIVRNQFLETNSVTATPMMAKSFDLPQSTPLYPVLPNYNNSLIAPSSHRQPNEFFNRANHGLIQSSSKYPSYPESPQLTVTKARRRSGTNNEVDDSNISLPPPDTRNNRVIPTKRNESFRGSTIPGRRITSGMLNIPAHSQADRDSLMYTRSREPIDLSHSYTDEEDEVDGDNDEVLRREVKVVPPPEPVKAKRGRKPKKKPVVEPATTSTVATATPAVVVDPSNPPKRKVGRPKKIRPNETNDDSKAAEISRSEIIEIFKNNMSTTTPNKLAKEKENTQSAATPRDDSLAKNPSKTALIKSLEITMNDTPSSRKSRTAKKIGSKGDSSHKVTKPVSRKHSVAPETAKLANKAFESSSKSNEIESSKSSVNSKGTSNPAFHISSTGSESSIIRESNSDDASKTNGKTSRNADSDDEVYVDSSSTLGRLFLKMKNFEEKVKSHSKDGTSYPTKMTPIPHNEDHVIKSTILNPSINLVVHSRSPQDKPVKVPARRGRPPKNGPKNLKKPGKTAASPKVRSSTKTKVEKAPKSTKAQKDISITEVNTTDGGPNADENNSNIYPFDEDTSFNLTNKVVDQVPDRKLLQEAEIITVDQEQGTPVTDRKYNKPSIPIQDAQPHSNVVIDTIDVTSTTSPDLHRTSPVQTPKIQAITNQSPQKAISTSSFFGPTPITRESDSSRPEAKATPVTVADIIAVADSPLQTRPSDVPSTTFSIPKGNGLHAVESKVVDSGVANGDSNEGAIVMTSAPPSANGVTEPHKNLTPVSVRTSEREFVYSPSYNEFRFSPPYAKSASSTATTTTTTTATAKSATKRLTEHDRIKERAAAKSQSLKSKANGSKSKKRTVDDSSSGGSSDDEGSSDSEAESHKRPRLVASIPSLLRRSQSPVTSVVSKLNHIVEAAPRQALGASRPPVGPGATAILNKSPNTAATILQPLEKSTIKKPILSSLDDLASRGVPEVKETTPKPREGTPGDVAKKITLFDDDSEIESESSEDSGSDDNYSSSDSDDSNEKSEKFLNSKKMVAKKSKAKRNLLSSLKR